MYLFPKILTCFLGALFVTGVKASIVDEAKAPHEDSSAIDLRFLDKDVAASIPGIVGADELWTSDGARRGLSGCVPSQPVAYENFEDGSLRGWTNGRIDSAPVFTKFLGRYGKHDRYPNDPFKTFRRIPRNADYVELTFDFYEIDSWDASHGDYLGVVIDGKRIDLGRFDTHQNENGRTGTNHGISFRIASQAPPRNIGFNTRWNDQIHRITIIIPDRFFERDGRIKVMFQTRVNEIISNESAGFDNIRITAKFNCRSPNPVPRPTRNPIPRPTRNPVAKPTRNPTMPSTPGGCTPEVKIYEENFEDGSLLGWTNGRIDFDLEFTKFLGRYGWADRYPRDPFKTYDEIPRNADYVELAFDFYEIDSWDASGGDYLGVVIDGRQVNLGRFDTHRNENGRSGTRNGIRFRISSQAAPTDIGFNPRFKDQIHRVTLIIPKTFYQRDGQIKVMFQTRLGEHIDNESAGFDNICITAKFECGCIPSKVVQPKITFEDGSTSGFTNGIIDHDPGFTRFLGRYGQANAGPGKDPFRYFSNIPKDADYAVLRFDFYEIDSWDSSDRDSLSVAIDHRTASIGRFDTHRNENGRSRRPGGILFKIDSQAAPRNIGFNARWKDQIHQITIRIPNRFFKNDGRIKVVFVPRLNEPDIKNESAGFDNIMLTAIFDCSNDSSDDSSSSSNDHSSSSSDDRRMLRGDGGEDLVDKDDDDDEELRLWELKDAENFVEKEEEQVVGVAKDSEELLLRLEDKSAADDEEGRAPSKVDGVVEAMYRIGTEMWETANHFLRG